VKNDRHGKAKILTQAEIQLLFSQGFQEERDRALFGICLFSACRIPESTHLKTPHSLMGLLKKLEIRDKSRDRFLLNVARF